MAGPPQDSDFPLEFGGREVPPYLGAVVKAALAFVALVLVFVLLSFVRSVYTDWLWYDALGYKSVYVKILTTRIVLFIIGTSVIGGLLGVSLYVTNRFSIGEITLLLPPEVVAFFRRLIFWGTVTIAAIVSVIFGAILASRWEIFLRFSSAVPFGQTDPVFNKDVSFYVFDLPVYSFLHGWLLGAVIVIVLGTLALYYAHLNLRGLRFTISNPLKVQVSILAAALMAILAWGHWLDRWELLLSDQGFVLGAAYADVNARKPALLILTIVASASGVLMLVNAYLRGLRLLVGAAVLWMVMAIVLAAAWPALMQQFTVQPNEFVKETPYILRNIEFTRKGFALDRVEEVFYLAETSVTAELVRANAQTINNIRLWDHRPLADVYKQIQLIRSYYDFKDADVDRYTLDGEYRQVLLAAREVAPERLAPEFQTWVNKKLVYTHGIGLAMSPVTDFTPEGRPEFFAKDIPINGVMPITSGTSLSEPEIVVENARIYYGENTTDYVIVNTNTDELDYQTEEGEVFRTKYAGDGGVHLSSFIRRLAYAWQFTDINILISGEISGDSLIQYRREISDRISTVAPFLLLDGDPYVVAAKGGLVWMQDAYTVSDQFPYSERFVGPAGESFNYIRNSVKVTVDAFDGAVRFYLWDSSDPIVRTYARIFPDLFLPKDQMPESLQLHVRYPQDFFVRQAEKYVKYHMQDPENFYNNEDLWTFANEKFGQSDDLQVVEPYYVIMKIPGEETEEFVQLLPYTPSQRQNLIGWLAARSDGDNYGRLVAFNFPKDRQIDGPEQVEARIDNDPQISAWFTLRCAEGSSCIRGNLLVIPIGSSILYAEPVYIQAEGVTFPQLKRVILATGDKVVMEDSLSEALVALTSGSSVDRAEELDGRATPGASSPAPGVDGGGSSIESAIEGLGDVIEGLREDLSRLEESLERLKELTGDE